MNGNLTKPRTKPSYNIKELLFKKSRKLLKKQKDSVILKSFVGPTDSLSKTLKVPISARSTKSPRNNKHRNSERSLSTKQKTSFKICDTIKVTKPSFVRSPLKQRKIATIINQKSKKERYMDNAKAQEHNTFKNYTTVGEIKIIPKGMKLIKDKSLDVLHRSQKTLARIKAERFLDLNEYKCTITAPLKYNLYKIKAKKYRCNLALNKNKEESKVKLESFMDKLQLTRRKHSEFKDNFLKANTCLTHRREMKVKESPMYKTLETNDSELKTVPQMLKQIKLLSPNPFSKFNGKQATIEVDDNSLAMFENIESVVKQHNSRLLRSILVSIKTHFPGQSGEARQ